MSIHRPATPDDVRYLLPRLRDADRAEVRALTGLPAAAVISQCIEASDQCWVGCTDDDEPGVLWGTQPVFGVPEVGWIWMVCTDLMLQHRWEFLAQAKRYLPVAHAKYPILTNHVDARNAVHIKWLRFMGFSFLRRIERWGAEGIPFIEFARLDTTQG